MSRRMKAFTFKRIGFRIRPIKGENGLEQMTGMKLTPGRGEFRRYSDGMLVLVLEADRPTMKGHPPRALSLMLSGEDARTLQDLMSEGPPPETWLDSFD